MRNNEFQDNNSEHIKNLCLNNRGSFKQLTEGLKMKLIDVYKADEGYNKTWKSFKVFEIAFIIGS